jgi:hypothetical protein
MKREFIAYFGNSSDPSSQVVRLVEAESEAEVWGMLGVILVQQHDPISSDWRRTPDPDWEALRAGCKVM